MIKYKDKHKLGKNTKNIKTRIKRMNDKSNLIKNEQ